MLAAYSTGFALSFSLILAIGSQNAFVLRQAILRQHIGFIVLFCAISDALLIIAGVLGFSIFVADFFDRITPLLFGGAAIWLGIYGLLRTRDAAFGNNIFAVDDHPVGSLKACLLVLVLLTFGNPHVYLDTVLLIGTVSLQFDGLTKVAFAVGAMTASFIFFIGLGYSGYLLSDFMRRPGAWRALNAVIALIMFALALVMLKAGGWV
jgi:L-lysine exporter family protein LysE/ArgO